MTTVTVIVPLARGEEFWRNPLEWNLPREWRLVLASPSTMPVDFLTTVDDTVTVGDTVDDTVDGNGNNDGNGDGVRLRWLHCAREGRAAQMNAAAEKAKSEWLWFVHADTVLPSDAAKKLSADIASGGDDIRYFRLRFSDGGAKMLLNEWGARLRCALFANPFGDQALCIRRAVWQRAGGFPEDADYGEDHLLVLRARKCGAGVRCVGAAVGTSARRYEREGWWRTVSLYRRLWMRQYWRETRGGGGRG